MPRERMYTMDQFLGLNEAADGLRELKMGQASRIVNFDLTEALNLAVRPGIQPLPGGGALPGGRLLRLWSGCWGERELLTAVCFVPARGTDHVAVLEKTGEDYTCLLSQYGALGVASAEETVKVFQFGKRLYLMSPAALLELTDGENGMTLAAAEPYVPTVITGASPMGGGTSLENYNLLTPKRKIQFSADGKTKAFVLPEEAAAVEGAEVDNAAAQGSFDGTDRTYTFAGVPPEGVNNVVITYSAGEAQARRDHAAVAAMPFYEYYNGATDTRLFFYGDGSNICFYTGASKDSGVDALYVPAMNEVAVDHSASPITGMIRHYGKLLAFKPDGAFAITYSPVTLDDGNVIAGFYLRAVHKEVGNEAAGQVLLVDNYPRTLSHGGLYEWRLPNSLLADERYAKRVSEPVARSLRGADAGRVVACDDGRAGLYYLFLNDAQGTVLVNRYGREVWTTYESPAARGVEAAVCCGGGVVFSVGGRLYRFDPAARYDLDGAGESHPIGAVWESGYMDFGADYNRKYSSSIWVSLLPEAASRMSVTAATDRRDGYVEKAVGVNVFDMGNVHYGHWSYSMSRAPKIRRVKLKVRKFVYYKLIFRVDSPGARATVLGFDQLVRYAGRVK